VTRDPGQLVPGHVGARHFLAGSLLVLADETPVLLPVARVGFLDGVELRFRSVLGLLEFEDGLALVPDFRVLLGGGAPEIGDVLMCPLDSLAGIRLAFPEPTLRVCELLLQRIRVLPGGFLFRESLLRLRTEVLELARQPVPILLGFRAGRGQRLPGLIQLIPRLGQLVSQGAQVTQLGELLHDGILELLHAGRLLGDSLGHVVFPLVHRHIRDGGHGSAHFPEFDAVSILENGRRHRDAVDGKRSIGVAGRQLESLLLHPVQPCMAGFGRMDGRYDVAIVRASQCDLAAIEEVGKGLARRRLDRHLKHVAPNLDATLRIGNADPGVRVVRRAVADGGTEACQSGKTRRIILRRGGVMPRSFTIERRSLPSFADSMDPQFYKLLHLIGLMLLFTGTGVLLTQGKEGALRKPALMFHGIGLFLLLLGGFGMLAKYAKTGPEIYSYTNVWVLLKLVIWLFFGVVIVLAKKGILEGKMGWWVCLAAGTIATWAALFKPFL